MYLRGLKAKIAFQVNTIPSLNWKTTRSKKSFNFGAESQIVPVVVIHLKRLNPRTVSNHQPLILPENAVSSNVDTFKFQGHMFVFHAKAPSPRGKEVPSLCVDMMLQHFTKRVGMLAWNQSILAHITTRNTGAKACAGHGGAGPKCFHAIN